MKISEAINMRAWFGNEAGCSKIAKKGNNMLNKLLVAAAAAAIAPSGRAFGAPLRRASGGSMKRLVFATLLGVVLLGLTASPAEGWLLLGNAVSV